MTFQTMHLYPPFLKGGKGGLNKRLIIPLNPPLRKGDLKLQASRLGSISYKILESQH
jgi:hypothetical protein